MVVSDEKKRRSLRNKNIMAFHRSRDGRGKTFEQGNKNKVPANLKHDVDSNPKEWLERFIDNDGDWGKINLVFSAEKTQRSRKSKHRTWVFETELVEDVCKGKRKRAERMMTKLRSTG